MSETKQKSSGRLTPCPDCTKEVSASADTCPHCGRPVPWWQKEISPYYHKGGQLVFGALTGANFVSVLQLLQVPELSRCLLAALCCFAASLPWLILGVGINGNEARAKSAVIDFTEALCVLAVLLSGVGFVLLFFHMSLIAGGIFVGALLGALALVFK